MDCACFRVVRAVNQAFQPRMHQRTCTHGARFNCSKELAVSQAVVTEVCTGLAQSDNFGVGSGVGVGQVAIPASTDDLAGTNYDRSHRDLARFQGALGGAKSFLHPELVGGDTGRLFVDRLWSLWHGRCSYCIGSGNCRPPPLKTARSTLRRGSSSFPVLVPRLPSSSCWIVGQPEAVGHCGFANSAMRPGTATIQRAAI